MTRSELIHLLGNIITLVDVRCSTYEPQDKERRLLENIRDDLDNAQRKLVRNAISDTTPGLQSLTDSLNKVNVEIRETIDQVEKVSATIAALVKAVGITQDIVKLIPKPV